MLNTLKTRKKDEGFTIIEVLIVLAIAGLILLVVFLAVPALQRNQRNNGRTSEASRFSSSVSNFVSNNQGNPPATANDVTGILSDFGNFKYMSGISATGTTCPASKKITAGQACVLNGVNAASAVTADAIMIDTGAVCGSPSSAGVQTTLGTTRQVAVIYTLESASGNFNQACIQAE